MKRIAIVIPRPAHNNIPGIAAYVTDVTASSTVTIEEILDILNRYCDAGYLKFELIEDKNKK